MVRVVGIDHLVIRVSDYERSKAFYGRLFEFLGFEISDEYPNTIGWTNGKTRYWIAGAEGRQKYKIGERWKIADPATKQPAVRNIFLSEGDLSVKAMQARGTAFWQCNVALGAIAQQLAQAAGMPAADVRADLIAGLNPGVHLVPAHVMAIGIAQEHGFTYMKA